MYVIEFVVGPVSIINLPPLVICYYGNYEKELNSLELDD